MFLRWDYNTVMLYGKFRDFAENLVVYGFDENFKDENIAKNYRAMAKINGLNKVYVKPFNMRKDKFYENVYNVYYKQNGFIFCDLNRYIQGKVSMQSQNHCGNTSSLLQSIALGICIKNF